MDRLFEFTIENSFDDLEKLEQALRAFLDESKSLPSRAGYATNLVLEEMLTNTIKFGYDDERKHYIDISVQISDEFVVIRIEDDANEFDPTQAAEPDIHKPIEERKIGGLGIHLTKETTERFEYERAGNRNILHLWISLEEE